MILYISNLIVEKIKNYEEYVFPSMSDEVKEEILVRRSVYYAGELDDYTELDNYVFRTIKENNFIKAIVFDKDDYTNKEYTNYKAFYEFENKLGFQELVKYVIDIYHQDRNENNFHVRYSVEPADIKYPTENTPAKLYHFEVQNRKLCQAIFEMDTENCKKGILTINKLLEKGKFDLEGHIISINDVNVTEYFKTPSTLEIITQEREEYDYSSFMVRIKEEKT